MASGIIKLVNGISEKLLYCCRVNVVRPVSNLRRGLAENLYTYEHFFMVQILSPRGVISHPAHAPVTVVNVSGRALVSRRITTCARFSRFLKKPRAIINPVKVISSFLISNY